MGVSTLLAVLLAAAPVDWTKVLKPGCFPSNPVEAGGRTYFMALCDDEHRTVELWRLGDAAPFASYAGSAWPIGAAGDRLVYAAAQGAPGERWLLVSDGTPAGTAQVRRLEPATAGPSDGAAAYFLVGRDRSYDFWKSDGTAAGTSVVHEGWYGQVPWLISVREGVVRFASLQSGGGYPGPGKPRGAWSVTVYELAAGKVRVVANLQAKQPGKGLSALSSPAVVGDDVYVADEEPEGLRFMRSKGAAFIELKVLPPGAESTTVIGSGGAAYLLVSRRGGFEAWRSDGTPEGTVQLARVEGLAKPIAEPPPPGAEPRRRVGRVVSICGGVVFEAVTGDGGAHPEIWVSDGTPAGTRVLFGHLDKKLDWKGPLPHWTLRAACIGGTSFVGVGRELFVLGDKGPRLAWHR